ncbi:immunoglobulin-like domain-containing receptor 2 isoform X3 [Astyanax mexicanus]|uniref:immunoglobulin-like domain-containing receptor 2 isoform X3 n=1 Tax=Astyanax mexicanus TaxID=7994 RepID=UPI0020CAA15D|nr:immunoglobulin-like domain-containing receptor 2 isoform X3 [Astyanax mexicanus]
MVESGFLSRRLSQQWLCLWTEREGRRGQRKDAVEELPVNYFAFLRTMSVFPSFWIPLVLFLVLSCDGVQVTVKDERKFAVLFAPVVLQCQYSTHSTQTAVVQWWYKSYCTDRTRDSFTFPESLGVQGSELGSTAHLDCADKSRTVRIVASGQGASLTLAEHYKGRDITIINKADLRIGELQWGDSGVYFCKVVISDDLEGKNEGQVELLVLGKTGVLDDVLPEFELEIMPEWVFVGSVVLGSVLFLLLVGVCWCQCCPHSCCCYLRCCCCPDTCCCPKHLYEAGKRAKSGQPPQIAMYSPYYIPAPVIPQAAPSLIEPKISTVPPSVENNIAAAAGSLSELSSLHDGDIDFRRTYRQVQKKALPPISDHNDTHLRTVSTGHTLRPTIYQSNCNEDLHDSRWNCRSEHLPRKAFDSRGRTCSLDELEEFARSYGPRAGRRGDLRDHERDIEMELRSRDFRPPYRDGPRRYRSDEEEDDDWRRRSPPSSPQKRRDTGDSERYAARRQSYDDAYLTSVLERKARGRGERGGRADEDSDTPSKGSFKKSSDCYYSRSPSNRPDEDDPLPPYCEVERYRTEKPAERERYRTVDAGARPFSYTRPGQTMSHTLQERREERDKPRKLTSHLSRESLIV